MGGCDWAGTLLLALALQPSDATAAGQATLYVVRPPSVAMAGMTAEIQVDGKDTVTLGPNGCAVLELTAGVRQVKYRWRAGALGNPKLETAYSAISVNLPRGGKAYLRLLANTTSEVNSRGGLNATTTWKMEQIPEQAVQSHLSSCKVR